MKMIQGVLKPDSGSFVVGETVQLAVVDQDRDALGEGNLCLNKSAFLIL